MKTFLKVFAIFAIMASIAIIWSAAIPPGDVEINDVEITVIDLPSAPEFEMNNIVHELKYLPCSPGDIFVSELSSDSYIASNNISELSRISKYNDSVLPISNLYYRSLCNQLNEGLFRLDIGEHIYVS